MKLHQSALPLLLVLAVLTLGACASGSAIVTGKTRAPIPPENVTLYLERPLAFEVIGVVNASSDAGWTEQGSVDYAIAELKKQAAKLGANGVLLTSTGETTSTAIGTNSAGGVFVVPVTAKSLQGRAIFVQRP